MGAITLRTYCRIAGSAVTLIAHGGNSIAMLLALRGDILKDPDIKNLQIQQFAFLTIWNVAFQMLFSLLNLACDLGRILNVFPKNLDSLSVCRDFIFDSLVWPCTLSVFIAFWPIFLYDREIIFPAYIDKAFSFTSNCIMHFFILIVVLWDIAFQERSHPSNKGCKAHNTQLIAIYVCYLTTIIANYHINKLWPYPFLYQIYGTIFFPLVLLCAGIILWYTYYVQWPLRTLIASENKRKVK